MKDKINSWIIKDHKLRGIIGVSYPATKKIFHFIYLYNTYIVSYILDTNIGVT